MRTLVYLARNNNSLKSFYHPSVTVADYADADPAVVKSGRVKKAVINAVEKEGNVTEILSRYL